MQGGSTPGHVYYVSLGAPGPILLHPSLNPSLGKSWFMFENLNYKYFALHKLPQFMLMLKMQNVKTDLPHAQ